MPTFNEFWVLYPRKISKRVAEKSWSKMTPQEQSDALEAITNHLEYWKLKNTETEYIPHPATWLNQGRWEDELDMTVKVKEDKSWMATEAGIVAKAAELGVHSMGLTYYQLKEKCLLVMAKKAMA
jgi:hypothetical protein